MRTPNDLMQERHALIKEKTTELKALQEQTDNLKKEISQLRTGLNVLEMNILYIHHGDSLKELGLIE